MSEVQPLEPSPVPSSPSPNSQEQDPALPPPPADGVPSQTKKRRPPHEERPLTSSEFTTSKSGVYTKWTFAVDGTLSPKERPQLSWLKGRALKIYLAVRRQILLYRRRWSAFRKLPSRLMLMFRFIFETTRATRGRFWVLAAVDFIQTLLPALRLHQTTTMLNLASNAAPGKPVPWVPLTNTILRYIAGEVLGWALSLYHQSASSLVQTKFKLDVQHQILRVHCSLDDKALSSRPTARLLGRLRHLVQGQGKPSYGRFGGRGNGSSPMVLFNLISSSVGLLAEAGVILSQLDKSNVLPVAATLIIFYSPSRRNYRSYSPRTSKGFRPFHDLTSNAYMRLSNLFKLGTSPALRREVTSLNIQSYILEKYEEEKLKLADLSIDLHPDHNYDSTWRDAFIGTTSILDDAVYILLAHNATGPFATLSQSRQLSFALNSLLHKYEEVKLQATALKRSLQAIEALYECQRLCEAAKEAPATLYERIIRDDGTSSPGMKIEFKDVSMRYSGSQHYALRHVTFTIQPGELVALVGHNGCGKTTLISLLALTESITQGEVLINGINIKDYRPEDLLPHMSFTFQTSPSLPLTVREYILLGGPSSSPERVKSALDFANATDIVANLDEGWNSYPGGIAGARIGDQDVLSSRHGLASPLLGADGGRWHFPRVVKMEETVPVVETSVLRGEEGGGGEPLKGESVREILARMTKKEEEDGEMSDSDSEFGYPGGVGLGRGRGRAESEDGGAEAEETEEGKQRREEEEEKKWEEEAEAKANMDIMDRLDVQVTKPLLNYHFGSDSKGSPVTVKFPLHSSGNVILSGGQWQRIALSRSVVKDSDLLVYDEPAASLDPAAEASLFEKIVELRGTSTIVFTTHRFGVTAKADKILMFDGGKLVEEGNHASLMRIPGGEYRRLWELQAAGYKVGPENDPSSPEVDWGVRSSGSQRVEDWLDLAPGSPPVTSPKAAGEKS